MFVILNWYSGLDDLCFVTDENGDAIGFDTENDAFKYAEDEVNGTCQIVRIWL